MTLQLVLIWVQFPFPRVSSDHTFPPKLHESKYGKGKLAEALRRVPPLSWFRLNATWDNSASVKMCSNLATLLPSVLGVYLLAVAGYLSSISPIVFARWKRKSVKCPSLRDNTRAAHFVKSILGGPLRNKVQEGAEEHQSRGLVRGLTLRGMQAVRRLRKRGENKYEEKDDR